MNLRTKMFLAILLTMLIVAGILSLNVVLETISQYKKTKQTYRDSLSQVVNNWISTNIPEEIDEKQILFVMKKYEKLIKSDKSSALFKSIVLFDKFRRIKYKVPEKGLNYSDRIFEPELIKAIENGETQFKGMKIYKPLFLQTSESNQNGNQEVSPEWVLGLEVNIMLPGGIDIQNVILPIFWVMGLGTILLVLVIYVLLSKLVLKPLENLSKASKKIAKGDYDLKIEIPPRSDEITELVKTFHSMMQEVQQYQQSLEDKVDQAVKQQRKAEQGLIIAQRLAATGTLAAGIAHEINNPLSGMQNAVRRILKKIGSNPEGQISEYLDLISEGLGRIQQIVNQVLQYSRRAVNPAPFDMKEPVEKSIAFLDYKAKRYNVEILTQPPEEEISLCFGDRGEIQQVVTNLILNGIEAINLARTKSDKGATRISTEDKIHIKWSETTDGIQVFVEDTGCGMSEAQINRAFDAFFTTKDEGTGLGLSIIHNIIDSHGGDISVESTEMKGTKVIFTIPKQLS